MSAFSKIIAAAESCGLRAFPDVYEGKDLDRWAVYQYTTEYGDLYAWLDDALAMAGDMLEHGTLRVIDDDDDDAAADDDREEVEELYDDDDEE